MADTTQSHEDRDDLKHYREVFQQTIVKLIVMYFVPLVLLALFSLLQYSRMLLESERLHMSAIAEHQANTLDLFMMERVVNLSNKIDDPSFQPNPSAGYVESILSGLRQTSNAFSDVSILDGSGQSIAYDGPYMFLQNRNYGQEEWFKRLLVEDNPCVITDVYLGFRDRPHFTIAVKREIGDSLRVLRAALTPGEIYDYVTRQEGSEEVRTALINPQGVFQLTSPSLGQPLQASPFQPPSDPGHGIAKTRDGKKKWYAYAWMTSTDWALIVQATDKRLSHNVFMGLHGGMTAMFVFFFGMGLIVIWIRARSLVRRQLQVEKTEKELSVQLVQASKLASVGELAAGIAHEINNPLAIIAEESGLMKDLMDPQWNEGITLEELAPHLNNIHDATFRARDITRKLLGFVRKQEVRVDEYDVHEIIEEVINNLLSSELNGSNVEIVREYCDNPKPLYTDKNQLEQVLLNLMKNAVDAMDGRGALTVTTTCYNKLVLIAVKDTGCGMTSEQMEKIFMPFHTTKAPGKGTGLGLSVSHSIVKNMHGEIYVESAPGAGSTFIVELPYRMMD